MPSADVIGCAKSDVVCRPANLFSENHKDQFIQTATKCAGTLHCKESCRTVVQQQEIYDSAFHPEITGCQGLFRARHEAKTRRRKITT
jgi:hypothetical protein